MTQTFENHIKDNCTNTAALFLFSLPATECRKCSSITVHFLCSTDTRMCDLSMDFLLPLAVIWCLQHAHCLTLNSCIRDFLSNVPLLAQMIPHILETIQTSHRAVYHV